MADNVIEPIQCPRCDFKTPEGLAKSIALVVFNAHVTEHMPTPAAAQAPPPTALAPRGPKLERPKVDLGVSMEEWNVYERRWDAYVLGSGLNAANCASHLFDCAGEELKNIIVKMDPTILSKPTADLLAMMKKLAVIPVAPGVVRAELMQMHQDRDQSFRTFAANVRGKAETCGYINHDCSESCDFTQSMVKDVLVAGIYNLDIRREVLSTDGILMKSSNDIIALVEAKEIARNALPPTSAALSTFKRNQRHPAEKIVPPAPPSSHTSQTAPCPDCKKMYSLFTEGTAGWNSKPHQQCIDCFRKACSNRNRRRNNNNTTSDAKDNAEIGGMFAQIAAIAVPQPTIEPHQPSGATTTKPRSDSGKVAVVEVPPYDSALAGKVTTVGPKRANGKIIRLPHQIFSKGQWRRARFGNHPKVKLDISWNPQDYKDFGVKCPCAPASSTDAVTDSGAMLNLWSYQECLEAGFTDDDLLPVSMDLEAANKSPISIEGALFLRLSGKSPTGTIYSCAALVYISRQARGFYLSLESMMDLLIIPRDFPHIGAVPDQPAMNSSCSAPTTAPPCDECPQTTRTAVPARPKTLPYGPIPENNERMEQWLLEYFASSTFNQCAHQPLPEMVGPPIAFHLKEGATPKAAHTPATISLHQQEDFQGCLTKQTSQDTIERVPHGEPVTWCSRCTPTIKPNGKMCFTVDYSALNQCCSRETHYVEPPFRVVRRIPGGTWKTVTDASDGYHLVPIRQSDRPLTTFITPYGRYRYKRAPQGFVGSGDGFNRRFDEILVDMVRKERVVDDVLHYDSDLEEHWWRTIDYLILVGKSGVILNPDKFRFARKTVDFAGFRITETTVEPLPKYLDAIRDFPTPTSTTDIRSWFGLVNQVSNYAQLRDLVAPFRPFRSTKCTFFWNEELDAAFQSQRGRSSQQFSGAWRSLTRKNVPVCAQIGQNVA